MEQLIEKLHRMHRGKYDISGACGQIEEAGCHPEAFYGYASQNLHIIVLDLRFQAAWSCKLKTYLMALSCHRQGPHAGHKFRATC